MDNQLTNIKTLNRVKSLLIAMYIAGIVGLNLPQTSELFKFLTPFNLIASVGFLLCFHRDFNKNAILFFIIAYFTGFFIEVIGVKTGKIFGIYEYQTTLGFKILEVPPLIGLNWLMLVYCVGSFLQKGGVLLSSMTGALFLTIFDYFAEPVAIRLEMWHWFGSLPPFQNYIGWFCVSFILLLAFHLLHFKKENPIAKILLFLQTTFFVVQYIFITYF